MRNEAGMRRHSSRNDERWRLLKWWTTHTRELGLAIRVLEYLSRGRHAASSRLRGYHWLTVKSLWGQRRLRTICRYVHSSGLLETGTLRKWM